MLPCLNTTLQKSTTFCFPVTLKQNRMRRQPTSVDPFRIPADDEHVAVFGHTGSGKTQMGAWLLSKRNLKARPHIIIDYKGDELLNSLDNVREIGFETPRKPGLYIIHPVINQQDDMEQWLWAQHEAQNRHLYSDEGYMLPANKRFGAVDAIQTQGRSRRVTMTTLSQRPVGIPRYIISESSHVVMFHLTDDRDIATAEQVVPRGFADWLPPEFQGDDLPRYWSRWYNVKNRGRYLIAPVPDADTIRADIDSQLPKKHRW